MSNSDLISNEHYEFLQLNQIGPLSARASKAIDPEEKSLRQFNAELLQRIGDFRKKNQELSESENALKSQLAQTQKQAQETERALTSRFENEIAILKRDLESLRTSHQESNEEWSRRLSRLSDDGWARDLENETLRRSADEFQQKLSQLEEENRHLRETVDSQARTLTTTAAATKARETQLTGAFEALRKEYADIDRCYAESNAALVKLRAESRELETRHETELQELTTYLTEQAKEESTQIREENARLREQLSARDVRLDQERASLETWKDQLTQLDQHLRHFSEKLKRGKAELGTLTKTLESEVRFAVANPFVEYLGLAEHEIESLNQQLMSTSALSPAKAKLESRLAQANSHREAIKAVLDKSEAQLNEHLKTIQSVLKSIEYFV